MSFKFFKFIFFIIIAGGFIGIFLSAENVAAADNDDPNNVLNNTLVISSNFASDSAFDSASESDSDGDGYNDITEIANGYSPFNAQKIKIDISDVDSDGLSDDWEIKFKTDPYRPDSDGDGYADREEIDQAYDPNSASVKKLDRQIEIHLGDQQLIYLVAGQPWRKFTVSTGKPSMPTPQGSFKIFNKAEKAWSKAYGLWMPYWLGLSGGRFGIHELPVWPNGYREGENHLGVPVSHGCIRLGVGPAQYLYERVEVGTMVVIK